MAMEKGGCKIGRVGESPKGGCKVGKKKKIVIRRKKKVDENLPQKTASSTMIKPAPKRVRKITIKKRVVAPAPNNVSFKTKDNKTVSFRTAPKKIKIRVKKNKTPELTAITGLTTSQANAMSPAELFGKLPKELGQMVLQPSRRGGGTQVGGVYTAKEMAKDIESMYQRAHPGRSIKTKIATTKMTRLAKNIMSDFDRQMPKKRKYNSFRFGPSLSEERRLEIKDHVKQMVRFTDPARPGYGRFDNL